MVIYRNNRDKKGRLVPKLCKSASDIRRYYDARFKNNESPITVERLRIIAIHNARYCETVNNGCLNKICLKFRYYDDTPFAGQFPKDVV